MDTEKGKKAESMGFAFLFPHGGLPIAIVLYTGNWQ
jgi:hypothetical protein